MIMHHSIVSMGYNSCIMNVEYKNTRYVAKGFTINNINFMNCNCFREICTTKKLIHPNIIRNYGVIVDNNNVYVLLEKADCVLVELFSSNVFDNIIDREKLLTDVSSGLKYLHNNNISHCDLSPNNIVNVNGVYKIIDFGNATKGHRFNTYLQPTPYIATFDKPQHIKVDIWALGCISYMIFFNVLPFYGTDKISQSYEITQYIIKKREDIDKNLAENNSECGLIHNMLEVNSVKRKKVYFDKLFNCNARLVKTNRNVYQYDVPLTWKIKLVEYLMSIKVNNLKCENIYITLLNSYKIKFSSYESYILNTVCMFWLSFKLTTNDDIYIIDLKEWLKMCGCKIDMSNDELVELLKNIMISIDWNFDDRNILDCIVTREIDECNIREDSLILYMNISTCRINEDKKYNQLMAYYCSKIHNTVSRNLSNIIGILDRIKPDFLVNIEKFVKKTLNNMYII